MVKRVNEYNGGSHETLDAQRVVLVLLPGTMPIDASLAIQALKTANTLSGYSAFHWRIATLDGQALDLEDGFFLQAQMAVGQDEEADFALIFGEWGIDTGRSSNLTDWLKRLNRRGVLLGAAGGACFELANAGLLNGYRVAVPWAYRDSFQELFPDIQMQDAFFAWDRQRITCTGGTACLDMMAAVIAQHCGEEIAEQVADAFNYQMRSEGTGPHRQRSLAFQKMSPKLASAVRIMEENLEVLLTTEEIASEIGTSKRQLERLFSHHLDSSPKRYYKRLRLKRARMLLRQTAMPVSEVAVACGFTSFSHFSRAYRGHFGATPKNDRSASISK